MSVCLLIMLDTLLLSPSLHCNTSLHLLTLHFLSFTLHYPLIWLNPLTFPIVLFHLTSLNYTSTVLIFKLISKIMNLFTALKNLSPFHFTFYLLLLLLLLVPPLPLSTLHFTIHIYNSLPFTFHVLLPSLLLTGFHFPNPHFENMHFTLSGSLFQSVMDLFTKEYFLMSVLCFLTLIFQ